ncbi:MAG TPA: hypothetical protein VM658_02130 [bacterium]|nr:hypothetical protein [bacterium]
MKSNNHAPASEAVDKVAVEFTFTPRNARARSSPAAPAPEPALSPDIPLGSLPRVTRLMALAIKFDVMLARGEVRDFADLARLGFVSRARITQIMNLLTLAPDLQEALLSLPRTTTGRDPIREQNLRPITAIPHWNRQRKMWEELATT